MKVKELLLPIALLVLVGSAGEAEAMTAADRQVAELMATHMCAQRAAVKAAGYEVGPIDRARQSVLMTADTAEERHKANEFFALVKRKCG